MFDTNKLLVTDLHNFFSLQATFIDSFLRGKPDELLKKRYSKEKWSAWEQFCHIVRYQEMFALRIADIFQDKNPFYEAYQPDSDASFIQIQNKRLQELIDGLQMSAESILSVVSEKDSDPESRQASHAKFGTLNAKEWVQFFMLHALHHWYDVQKQVLLNRK